jgi:hypothetical protein
VAVGRGRFRGDVPARSCTKETGTYLGAPLVLIAACLAIAYRRRPVTAVCGVLAVVSYALSLGTRISIRNHATGLPGPFAALAHVPFIQDIEPARFSLFTVLFVAIVLGTGLDALARPASTRSSKPRSTRRPPRRARRRCSRSLSRQSTTTCGATTSAPSSSTR